MTPKNGLHFDFGCHFCKINAHTAIWRHFAQISTDFARIFSESQVLGGTLAPHLLHQRGQA